MPIDSNPVNWFEIPVADLDRAKSFHETIFKVDLPINDMNGNRRPWFPMEMGQQGAAGTLIQGEGYTPSHEGSLVYIYVPKIDATLEAINDSGGKTLLPKTSIGQYGYIAHFQDTEGNRVALHETPETP